MMSDLCNTYSLSNFVNGVTCVKSQSGLSIDVMLTNRPRHFSNTTLIEAGLIDCHKMSLELSLRAFRLKS